MIGRLISLAVVAAFSTATSTVAYARARSPSSPNATPIETGNPQVQEQAHKIARETPVPPLPGHHIAEDRTGRKQVGNASVYASHFQGRKMANGKPFDHEGQAAASKTLPLGTVAKVTNLQNGQTAVVTIQDHGPYVDGRIVDVTNSTAEQLRIEQREGVAPVVVAPVAIPQPDGTVTPGAGALPGPATAK